MQVNLASARDSSGQLNVIALNQNRGNVPFQIVQNLFGTWSPAVPIPNPNNKAFSSVAAGVGANGQLQVILLGQADNRPYLVQIEPGVTPPSPSLLPLIAPGLPAGMQYNSIVTCSDASNFLVFLGTTEGPVVVVSQDLQNNWQFDGTLGFNGTLAGTFNAAGIAAGVGNGLVQLVGVSINSSVNNPPFAYTQSGLGAWSGIESQVSWPQPTFSKGLNSVAVGAGNSGILQAIVLATDGNAYLLWLDGSGNWNFGVPEHQNNLPNPDSLSFTSVVTGVGHDSDKLQVVLLNSGDQMPYLIWQDTSGDWSFFGQLPVATLNAGVTFTAVAMGIGNDRNKLQVFLLGTDGHVYLIWQNVDGTWFPFQDSTGKMIQLM